MALPARQSRYASSRWDPFAALEDLHGEMSLATPESVPQAWAAMETANRGSASAYGDDQWTARAANAFRDLFETNLELFFVFNGTAAN